jgi:hypothetical protein
VRGRGEYPEDWEAIAALVKYRAGWACEHCGHLHDVAAGRCLTVHHLDGDKSSCTSENLVALCQVCHLHIQARFSPAQVVMGFAVLEWMIKRGLGGVNTQKSGESPEIAGDSGLERL